MPMVVANRYARALAEVVAPSGDYRRVLQELQDFVTAYRESLELREVFASPAVALPQKMNVLVAIGQKLGESPVTLNLCACSWPTTGCLYSKKRSRLIGR